MKLFENFSLGQLDAIARPLVDEMYKRRPSWAVASISEFDAALFAGLIMAIKPKRLIEIGVASGWGSVILLEALKRSGCRDVQYYAVDLAKRFFYDENYATGQAVDEVVPQLKGSYCLFTGRGISELTSEIGGEIDFAFIDAHHMHPWATLDLLSLLPLLKPGAWVALHDLNLCRKEDQEHRNRGPKYLFEGWEDDRIHSIQVPTMAGALRIGDDPRLHLPVLLEILYTPWELSVEERFLSPLINSIERNYGLEWKNKFQRAMEMGNYLTSKMHSRDIDVLAAEVARLSAGAAARAGNFLNKILRR